MDQNKELNEKMRRQFVGDHEMRDCEIERTTSWPDGLNESSRFLPELQRPLRRTDSSDDIERHELYFDLVQKNQGKQFTWRHYCNTLLADLQNSNITASLNKMSIQPACASVKLHECKDTTVSSNFFEKRAPRKRSFHATEADVESISSTNDVRFSPPSKNAVKMSIQSAASPFQVRATNFGTAATTVSSMQNLLDNHTPKKRPFLDVGTNVDSVSSMNDEKFQTPSRNALKKMCTEIRTLAQETCKTVVKIATPTKHSSSSGDVKCSPKMHKKWSKHRIGEKDCKKLITSGMPSSANTSRPINFQSPTITPAFAIDERTKKLRRKPLFKL